jgi:hypothetical protein
MSCEAYVPSNASTNVVVLAPINITYYTFCRQFPFTLCSVRIVYKLNMLGVT